MVERVASQPRLCRIPGSVLSLSYCLHEFWCIWVLSELSVFPPTLKKKLASMYNILYAEYFIDVHVHVCIVPCDSSHVPASHRVFLTTPDQDKVFTDDTRIINYLLNINIKTKQFLSQRKSK